MMKPIVLCVHGGAGDRTPSPDDAKIENALRQSLDSGWAVLDTGGSALDAVQIAIGVLEDEPLFNAGYGAALSRDGTVELDAALMDGSTERAGAIIGVQRVRNPIVAARMVLERSPNVILAGHGAEQFAMSCGCEMVEPEYFVTQRSQAALERYQSDQLKSHLGTVGAVALDKYGYLAAGNSTGGTIGKMPGRVGDTPIIGGGTYANSRVAIACTGYGEYFIRTGAALRIALLHELCDMPLLTACLSVLERVKCIGGRGGVIALDAAGVIATPFTTTSMARAWRSSFGMEEIALW